MCSIFYFCVMDKANERTVRAPDDKTRGATGASPAFKVRIEVPRPYRPGNTAADKAFDIYRLFRRKFPRTICARGN